MKCNQVSSWLAVTAGLAFLLAPTAAGALTKTWTDDPDWASGAENNVNHTDTANQIQLDADTQEEMYTPFIWIANSGSNTVAKIDTRTGAQYPGSPYQVCANPSRTAVDVFGNCWVGCRNDGRVMKLASDDGRVLVDVKPGGNVIRALAIDPEGFIWAGEWTGHRLYKLDPNSGGTVAVASNVICPYGAAADKEGRIWAVGSWCGEAGVGVVTLVDKNGSQIRTWTSSVGNLYGIGIDSHNHAWIASWQSKTVTEFDPNSGSPVRNISLRGVGRGVAVDGDDNIWIAMSNNSGDTNEVAKLTRAAGFSVSYTSVGVGPVGVAVDDQDNVWAVNMGSSSVTKIRASDGVAIGTYPTGGSGPYTYSDMTGFQLQSIAKPATGTWIVRFDTACTANWRDITWTGSMPNGSTVTARARSAASEAGLAGAGWTGPYTSGSALTVANNPWIEVELTLSSTDASRIVPTVQDLTLRYEGVDEICDTLDNDCDGEADESLVRACVTACGQGTETCIAGQWANCDAPPVLEEVCDYIDNDCDGATDEGVQNACGECGPVPEEICDGIDNNCDGVIDEGCDCIAGQTRQCGTDVGECKSGVQVCIEFPDHSTVWDTECAGEVGPTLEICDGLDNDCDGITDEGCDCVTGETRACGSDIGACRPGIEICDANGRWGECLGDLGPSEEMCDCFDNDCDGEIDEGDLCPSSSVCIACACAEPCVFGECPKGQSCSNGYCIPQDCTGVTCGAGEVCEWGQCVPSCEGIECPAGLRCLHGDCVFDDCRTDGCPEGQKCANKQCEIDPCHGISCGESEFCRDGVCIASCGRVSCPAGQVCLDGACVADPCAPVTCEPGTYCLDGYCVGDAIECAEGEILMPDGTCTDDPCGLIECPLGEVCERGQCVAGDTDGDGTVDYDDPDIDGDGVPNDEDVGPNGEDWSRDHDGDYIEDPADPDDDNDGVLDEFDRCGDPERDCSRDHDNDGIADAQDPDDDNDGVPDTNDDCGVGMNCTYDHDNDGRMDEVDLDDDQDGVNDREDRDAEGEDRSLDHDNDGTNDGADPDDDEDGTPDGQDICGEPPKDCSRDTDNDGEDNADDADDDGDGHDDAEDAYPLDPTRWGGEEPPEEEAPPPDTCGCGATGAGGLLGLLALLGLGLRRRSLGFQSQAGGDPTSSR